MRPTATGTTGLPPTVKIEPSNPLREVYERCYETKEYRRFSPGETLVPEFWRAAEPYKTQTVIDYGCGTGRASLQLARKGLNVTAVDFVDNSLDPEVKEAVGDKLEFLQADLTKPLPEDFPTSMYGYCCDVLEHIPEEDVEQFVDNILAHSKHCFFQISCVKDHFGQHEHIKGDEEELQLHLTVHPYSWWLQRFAEKGAVVHMSKDNNSSCIFYVTIHKGIVFDASMGYLNTEPEKLKENIRSSSKLPIKQIGPHEPQDKEIMLLAGGPSINDFEDEVIQNRKDGMPLVTVNGSYLWAIERGLSPSMQVLIDAREFNERFTRQHELTSETQYLLSSAADPAAFENLPLERTFVFHTVLDDGTLPVLRECYGELNETCFPIPGGCTVTLRALAALRLLGFYKIHVYGFDSCIFPEAKQHHGYEQKENDKDLEDAIRVTVAGGSEWEKEFICSPWQVFQAKDFAKMSTILLKDTYLDVKGDGLIAHMLKANAALSDEPEEEITRPRALAYKIKELSNEDWINGRSEKLDDLPEEIKEELKNVI